MEWLPQGGFLGQSKTYTNGMVWNFLTVKIKGIFSSLILELLPHNLQTDKE